MNIIIDTGITQKMRNIPDVMKEIVKYNEKHKICRTNTITCANTIVDAVRMVGRFGIKVEMSSDEFTFSCQRFNELVTTVMKHAEENGHHVDVYPNHRL